LDDLARSCCLNSRCADFSRRGAANLGIAGQLGKDRWYCPRDCRSCRACVSERKGTALNWAHPPEERVASFLERFTEGCGAHEAAWPLKVDSDTDTRFTRAAGARARIAHVN
jgi:hypothetical protein